MDYEWDLIKAKFNLAKHDISFTDAAEALEDPYKLEDLDPYECEERNQVLCLHEQTMVVLFIVTTESGEGVCRIISARRALRHEQERYWQNRSL